MRIGLIYERFVRGGGLENYLTDFARALAADGHEIEVLTSSTDEETKNYGFEIHQITQRGSGGGRLKNFADDAAVLANTLAFDATLGFGRTYAQDIHRAGGGCHATYSRTALPLHKRLRPKNAAELALEKRLYTSGETRHFVVNSEMVRDQIAETYDISKSLITVIHTAVDGMRFHPADITQPDGGKAELCERLGSDPNIPAILFVSLNHERKGLEPLLQALGETGAHLWIIGSPLSRAHEKLIDHAAIRRRVFHLGQTKDPSPFYRAADFFVHPTRYDACANTVLQAMASGLPSIVSTRDGAREFIEEGTNGFLLEDPESHEAIAAAINQAIHLTPSEYELAARAARETTERLTWDHHVHAWGALLRGLNGNISD